jgi:uncharacterized membrane protein
MDPVVAIGIWAVLFVGSHLVISSASVRPGLIAKVGELPYRGIYSLVALATFIALINAFAPNKHSGPLLWYLRGNQPLRGITWLLMLAALIFLVASFVNPNPGAIGAPSGQAAHGILKITRHPNFTALTLFGFAHLLMNGWLGDVIFFGTFPALGILGGFHQDARKRGESGESYRQFVAATSFFPGAALWSGRQHWSRQDMPWAAIGIGAAATIALVLLHPMFFGGAPLG